MKSETRYLFGIVALAVLSHSNSLPGSFHYDDAHSIVNNPAIRTFEVLPRILYDPAVFSGEPSMAMYRPLVVLSYVFNYALGAHSASGFVLFNLLLHAGVSLFAFLFLRSWSGDRWGAWGAAALFAVHPVNAQVVNYVSSRSESVAALGVLCALYYALNGRHKPSWMGYGLGLLAKSQAVVLLPLLWVVRPIKGASARPYIPYVLITVLFLSVIYGNEFLPRSLAQEVRPYAVHFYTQIKVLVYYLYLFAMPNRLSVEHPLAESATVVPAVWLSFLLLGSIAGWALFSRRWCARGVLFWMVTMSVTTLVPLNVLVNEHRLYLGTIGLCAVSVGMCTFLRQSVRYWGMGCIFVMAVLGWQRNAVWETPLSLWSDAVQKAPNAFRAQSNLGFALIEMGAWAQAKSVLLEAVSLNPTYARTWSNLGLVYEEMGEYTQAESAYRRAIELGPRHSGFRVQLGRLYLGLGRYGKAINLLEDVGEGDVYTAEVYAVLGLAHQRAGRLEDAVLQYNKSISLSDDSYEVFNNLGLVYQDLGKDGAALSSFTSALERAPENIALQINRRQLLLRREGMSTLDRYAVLVREYPKQHQLWRAYASLLAEGGRLEEALKACQMVLTLDPSDQRVRQNLDQLRARVEAGTD